MAVSVDLLAPSGESEYARFVAAHPEALFQHRLEWSDVLVRALGVAPRTLVARNSERIVGALPLFEVVTPVHGRRLLAAPGCRRLPLLADSAETRTALVAAASALGRELACASVELRCGAPFPAGLPYSVRTEFVNFAIDLSVGEEALWSGFRRRSVRQAISRARRLGVVVEQAEPGDLSAYRQARGLALQTRHRQGAPPLPWEFFEALADLSLQSRCVRLLIARVRGRCAAAGIFLQHGRTAHFFDAVSTDDRLLQQLRPNHAVFWAAILAALRDGCSVFDVGPNHRLNKGLSAYKYSWGATRREVSHYFLPLTDRRVRSADIQHPTYRLARAALRCLPPALFARLGPLLALEAY